jgi:hypothetical protein
MSFRIETVAERGLWAGLLLSLHRLQRAPGQSRNGLALNIVATDI